MRSSVSAVCWAPGAARRPRPSWARRRSTRARVVIDGKRVKGGSPAHAIAAGIALLPEDRKLEGILPNLSIRDNIALAILPRLSRLGVVADGKLDAIVASFMKQLNIRAYGPGQRVGTLSGGNQQKVLLARWLCLSPKLMILDEPTRGIDVGAKAEVRATMDDLAKEGLGVLLISSETEELVGQSHRIFVLKEGRVVGVLAGDDVNEGELVHAIAGETPGTTVTEIVEEQALSPEGTGEEHV